MHITKFYHLKCTSHKWNSHYIEGLLTDQAQKRCMVNIKKNVVISQSCSYISRQCRINNHTAICQIHLVKLSPREVESNVRHIGKK